MLYGICIGFEWPTLPYSRSWWCFTVRYSLKQFFTQCRTRAGLSATWHGTPYNSPCHFLSWNLSAAASFQCSNLACPNLRQLAALTHLLSFGFCFSEYFDCFSDRSCTGPCVWCVSWLSLSTMDWIWRQDQLIVRIAKLIRNFVAGSSCSLHDDLFRQVMNAALLLPMALFLCLFVVLFVACFTLLSHMHFKLNTGLIPWPCFLGL